MTRRVVLTQVSQPVGRCARWGSEHFDSTTERLEQTYNRLDQSRLTRSIRSYQRKALARTKVNAEVLQDRPASVADIEILGEKNTLRGRAHVCDRASVAVVVVVVVEAAPVIEEGAAIAAELSDLDPELDPSPVAVDLRARNASPTPCTASTKKKIVTAHRAIAAPPATSQ